MLVSLKKSTNIPITTGKAITRIGDAGRRLGITAWIASGFAQDRYAPVSFIPINGILLLFI